jgi:hypothetical protein
MQYNNTSVLLQTLKHVLRLVGDTWYIGNIPYIPESDPHPFYSFRGLKKSDAD